MPNAEVGGVSKGAVALTEHDRNIAAIQVRNRQIQLSVSIKVPDCHAHGEVGVYIGVHVTAERAFAVSQENGSISADASSNAVPQARQPAGNARRNYVVIAVAVEVTDRKPGRDCCVAGARGIYGFD